MTEQEVLAKYSKPSLRRGELTRQAKREWLMERRTKFGLTPAQVDDEVTLSYGLDPEGEGKRPEWPGMEPWAWVGKTRASWEEME